MTREIILLTRELESYYKFIHASVITILREGIDQHILTRENRSFDKEIMKLQRLGLIKLLNIGNKLEHSKNLDTQLQ